MSDNVPLNFYLHNRFWSDTALKKWNYEMTGRPVWLVKVARKMKKIPQPDDELEPKVCPMAAAVQKAEQEEMTQMLSGFLFKSYIESAAASGCLAAGAGRNFRPPKPSEELVKEICPFMSKGEKKAMSPPAAPSPANTLLQGGGHLFCPPSPEELLEAMIEEKNKRQAVDKEKGKASNGYVDPNDLMKAIVEKQKAAFTINCPESTATGEVQRCPFQRDAPPCAQLSSPCAQQESLYADSPKLEMGVAEPQLEAIMDEILAQTMQEPRGDENEANACPFHRVVSENARRAKQPEENSTFSVVPYSPFGKKVKLFIRCFVLSVATMVLCVCVTALAIISGAIAPAKNPFGRTSAHDRIAVQYRRQPTLFFQHLAYDSLTYY